MEGTYKVIELEKYGGRLNIKPREFRELKGNEVLVKIMAATIHPADIAFLSGQYGNVKPETPLIPGFEGSGLIVKVGNDVDQSLVNKRVSVSSNPAFGGKFEGLWAEYHYATLETILPYDGEVDFEKIALAVANPMTAIGFVDTIRKHGVSAVVQDGASSACGKILIRLCKREGIKTINIVRKVEHIENLKSIGADHVISTSEPEWEKKVEELAKELDARVCFECVGGDTTGKVLSALPNKSTLYHYGNLELKRLGQINTNEFVFRQKRMEGWWLKKFLIELTTEQKKAIAIDISNDIKNGSVIFGTNISKTFKFEEYEKAFEHYMMNMSEGKVLIKPHDS